MSCVWLAVHSDFGRRNENNIDCVGCEDKFYDTILHAYNVFFYFQSVPSHFNSLSLIHAILHLITPLVFTC